MSYKSTDNMPEWPAQVGFMRAELCITFLRPFMSQAEYMSVRTKIFQWDCESDTANNGISERSKAWRAAQG